MSCRLESTLSHLFQMQTLYYFRSVKIRNTNVICKDYFTFFYFFNMQGIPYIFFLFRMILILYIKVNYISIIVVYLKNSSIFV